MLALWMIALIVLGAADGAWKSFEGYCLVDTDVMPKNVIEKVKKHGDFWDFWVNPGPGRGATIFLAPDQLHTAEATLKELGVSYKIRTPDLNSIVASQNMTTLERQTGNMFERFNTLSQIYAYLNEMAGKYPELLTVHEAGLTYEKRPIKYVKISDSRNKKSKKAIFIDAGIHAREWISPPVALYALHQLVEHYENNKELLDGVDWYILPVLNPDGYDFTFTHDRMWRKNRSYMGSNICFGVDLNRNFPDHWNLVGHSTQKCSDIYSGPSAASELETQALTDLLMALRSEIAIYLTLHSFGGYMFHPFGYTPEPAEDEEESRALLEEASAAVESVRGTKFTIGPAAKLIYLTSGASDDWAKNVAKIKYSYCFELPPVKERLGFYLPTSDILPIVEEMFQALKVFGNHVRKMSEGAHSS